MDLSNPLLWLVLVLAVILGLVISRPRPASLTPPRRPEPPARSEPPATPAPPRPHEPVPFQIGILNLQRGDVVVLRCTEKMPCGALESMLRQLSTAFPPGTKAVVLGPGTDLSVMRPVPQEEKPHG